MIRRILCPTDLTENSHDSLAYAFRLARENGAQLIVFHATSFPTISQHPLEPEPHYQWEQWAAKFKMDQVLADAERKVKSFVTRRFAAETKDVSWKPTATLGKVPKEIVTVAFQEEVDLIVMARCKRGTFARIFTLSISEAVSRGAPCPVLSIDTTQFVRPSPGLRLPPLREVFQGY